ncbi:MAG: N-acetylmuramoyl-L-alanine amidase [Deltaproteobacteria bacterium]|nr:N-acetylmuramoyl-L-alanine amidase [Deltaproteobacteria bacterium]
MRLRPLVLLVLISSCAAPEPEATHDDGLSGDSALLSELRAAGLEHGVPPEILAAIAWSTSRGSMRAGEISIEGGVGLMDLREGGTLAEAARRTGLPMDALTRDAAANIAGGAAVLGDLGRRMSADPPSAGSFVDALAAYGGGDAWADAVLDALERGATMVDDDGGTIVIAPRAVWRGSVGVHELDARPDYADAEWVGPACSYTNSSRGAADISGIVIHTCQGGFAGCWGWLAGCHDVSAHYVVRSSDGHVVQVVEGQDVAWHDACNNTHTIGIEHEGFVDDPGRWYTDEMYCGSAELTRWLCDAYDIPCDRAHVKGHGEWDDCSDHTDPGGGWDWDKYMRFVRDGCRCTPVAETCDGQDNDCDGEVDEGVKNRCGGCGPEPAETCNCADDDCDGQIDEDACAGVARPVDHSAPARIGLGDTLQAWVTFANEGTDTWEPGGVILHVEGDRTDLGVPGQWPELDVPARVDEPVAPGQTARLELQLQAPADAALGARSLTLRLAHADGTALRDPCDASGALEIALEVVAAGQGPGFTHSAPAGDPLSTGLGAGCATVPGAGRGWLLAILLMSLVLGRRSR